MFYYAIETKGFGEIVGISRDTLKVPCFSFRGQWGLDEKEHGPVSCQGRSASRKKGMVLFLLRGRARKLDEKVHCPVPFKGGKGLDENGHGPVSFKGRRGLDEKGHGPVSFRGAMGA